MKVNYEMVDLGLPSGTLWAKCNIGAEKETDYGLYFKLKDIECGSSGVAQIMGSQYYLPTLADFQELIDNTTNEWVINYKGSGINGRLFISKKNGKTLFFPAAGCYGDNAFFGKGIYGYIWSSSPITPYHYSNWYLGFSDYICCVSGNTSRRGHNLRAVCK